MTDNKLTDEQIIKALECCSVENCEDCKKDWSYVSQWDCMRHIMRLALDLINRQKAENYELQHKISELEIELEEGQDAHIRTIVDKDAEIERLRPYKRRALKMLYKHTEEVKSEARKEFWDRLKKEAITKYDWNDYIEMECGDNLLKEMEGE